MFLLERFFHRFIFTKRAFDFFQNLGLHVTKPHYYSPIPDTAFLKGKSEIWKSENKLVSIDLNLEKQLYLLNNIIPKYLNECNFPLEPTDNIHEYYVKNGAFGYFSALVLHCLIREVKPKKIIEVGSGNSTRVSANACLMNKKDNYPTELISIEPYPVPELNGDFHGLTEIYPVKVEDINIEFFSQLEENDILFIDSSHVSKIGGDVNHLYLNVIPSLKKGVIIHIHDIFFPNDYPKSWILQNRRFWTEQYLLQAFLAFNNSFEVLWCESYMHSKYKEKMDSIFPPPENLGSYGDDFYFSSFYMRKNK